MSMLNDVEWHNGILEALDDPALIVNRGIVSQCNVAARELLGDHIAGQDVRMAIRHPDGLSAILATENKRQVLSGLNATLGRVEISCSTLKDNIRFVIFRDVSVQERVARVHTDFVANASHELRTPLANILGYVETLSDDKMVDDGETRDRFLGIISREAQRMNGLIDDLMSLSRIEARKHDLPQTLVDLKKAIARVDDQDRGRLSMPEQTLQVRGDESQLVQLFQNLVSNAIRYGHETQPIDIVIEATSRDSVIISVTDYGEGIAPEHLPRLTERFFRVDDGRSRAAGGTGLGLSIVKHIVERHRGRFDISSKLGVGTTASVILPLGEPQ